MHLGCLQKGLTMGAFVFSFKDILTTFASQTEWVEKISQKAEFSSSAEVERCKQQDLKTLNTALGAESALWDRETERDGCSDSQVWNSQCIFLEETLTYWPHIFSHILSFPIKKNWKKCLTQKYFQLQKGGSHSQRCREEYNILLSHAEQREPWKSAEKRGCKISTTPVCSQVETINLDFSSDSLICKPIWYT